MTNQISRALFKLRLYRQILHVSRISRAVVFKYCILWLYIENNNFLIQHYIFSEKKFHPPWKVLFSKWPPPWKPTWNSPISHLKMEAYCAHVRMRSLSHLSSEQINRYLHDHEKWWFQSLTNHWSKIVISITHISQFQIVIGPIANHQSDHTT